MKTEKINLFCIILLLISSLSVYSQSKSTPYIHVTSPNGGERWAANSTQTITWQSSNITSVKIEYSLSGGMVWHTVVSSVDASLGQYSWVIPNVQIAEVLIKISDVSNTSTFDISDNLFSIFIQSKINKYKIKQRSVQSGTPIKIMPLGDSITEGDGDDPQLVGYRSKLFDLLEAAGYNFDFVGTQSSGTSYSGNVNFDPDHEGHGGMEVGPPSYLSAPTMLDNIDTYLSSNLPDIVLFHMGTNDLDNEGSGTAVAYRISHQLKDVIVNHILVSNPNCETFLARIIHNNHVSEVNLNISIDSLFINTTSGFTTDEKKRVQKVDMHSSPQLIYPDDFSYSSGSSDYSDLHPIESGYNKMADHWFAAMQAYYQPTLAGPANSATDQAVDVTLSWNEPQAVTDNTSLTYELQISTSSDFASTVYDNSSISSSTNSLSAWNLDYATQYYWRVRITNYGWSDVRSFTTTPLYVNASLILQGPYISSTSPYMSTYLTSLPDFPKAQQPYHDSPWNYLGTESITTIPSNVVDWVLIQLRAGSDPSTATTVAQRAAFLKDDGTIVDLDGSSPVSFSGTVYGTSDGVQYADNYCIVIKQRNHLGVISNTPAALTGGNTLNYDFINGDGSQIYPGTGVGAKELATNIWGLIAGDANGSTVINATDYLYIKSQSGGNGYFNGDCNLSGTVNATDYLVVKPNSGNSSQVP